MVGQVSEFAERHGSIESGFVRKDELLEDIEFVEVAHVGRSKVFYVEPVGNRGNTDCALNSSRKKTFHCDLEK